MQITLLKIFLICQNLLIVSQPRFRLHLHIFWSRVHIIFVNFFINSQNDELLKSLEVYFESEKLDQDLVLSYYKKIKSDWEEDSFIERSYEDITQQINKLQQRLQTIRVR